MCVLALNHIFVFYRDFCRNHPEIDILFKFLKEQEPTIAAAAYNAMICGFAKYFNVRYLVHFKSIIIMIILDHKSNLIKINIYLNYRDDVLYI